MPIEDRIKAAQESTALSDRINAALQAERRPESIAELTGGYVTRGTAEAIGGTVGSVLGAGTAGLGGVAVGAAGGPPGMAAAGTTAALLGEKAGGALGAAGGSLTFDVADQLLRSAGILKEREIPESPLEPTMRAIKAGREDLLYGTGFQVAGAAFRAIKPGVGLLIGARDADVTKILQDARLAGLTVEGTPALGAVDVVPGARGAVIRGGAKVLGIFPFIGSPYRKAAVQKVDVVTGRINTMLNALAPSATMADELGVDMVRAAKGARKEFTKTAGVLYDNFRNLARNASKTDIVPTGPVKGAAADFVEEVQRGQITLADGETLVGPVADELNEYLTKLVDLPDKMTIDQAQKLSADLEAFIRRAINDGFDVKRVASVKSSIEEALSQIDVTGLKPGEGEAIIAARDAANEFYSKGILKFQTTTAKKFARTDPNVFRAGPERVGSLNEDEIARVAVNLKSKQAISDLRELVGDDLINKAARRHIENAWDAAIIVDKDSGFIKGMDWDKMRGALGLTVQKTDERAAMREFLKNSDVDFNELTALISTASRIQVPSGVSSFVARRAALGGMSSAVGGATATSLIADSVLSSLGVAFLLRHGGKVLSDPAQLKAMRRVVDASVPINQRRALFGRLLDATFNNVEENKE